jgi:uncharacterized membrane protein
MENPATTKSASRSGRFTAALGAVVLVVAIVFITQAGSGNAWYSAFKAVHVLAAILWVGGGLYLTILALHAERKRDPVEMTAVARQAAEVGERIFGPAGGVVFAMGIAMMLNTNWGWGTFWVTAGLVGFAISFINGVAVLGPLAKRVAAITEEKGATHPETMALIERLLLLARVDIAVLLVVVLDMVVKPFA